MLPHVCLFTLSGRRAVSGTGPVSGRRDRAGWSVPSPRDRTTPSPTSPAPHRDIRYPTRRRCGFAAISCSRRPARLGRSTCCVGSSVVRCRLSGSAVRWHSAGTERSGDGTRSGRSVRRRQRTGQCHTGTGTVRYCSGAWAERGCGV